MHKSSVFTEGTLRVHGYNMMATACNIITSDIAITYALIESESQ